MPTVKNVGNIPLSLIRRGHSLTLAAGLGILRRRDRLDAVVEYFDAISTPAQRRKGNSHRGAPYFRRYRRR
jgi:hypothetical protein